MELLLRAAAAVVDAKHLFVKRMSRKLTDRLYLKQVEGFEKRAAEVVKKVMEEQVREIVSGLSSGRGGAAKIEFDPADPKWRAMLTDALLPVMAVEMLEAMSVQYQEIADAQHGD